jgi:hypothetical protein
MAITIELAPDIQAELARQAASQGLEIDTYAAGLLADAARSAPLSEKVIDAIERFRSFGKNNGLTLGGMTIRELRREARP